MGPGSVVGVVLAAGGGARYGSPKALARDAAGTPWLVSAVRALEDGGCDRVLVVLGAAADEARALLPADQDVVVAERWADGMGASIAAAVAALPEADTALLTLVDLPAMPPEVVARVLDAAPGRADLARAVYADVPGHPVALGRDHWAAFGDSLRGDEGGRRYLEEHEAAHVECGDLFSGRDVDRRERSADA